MSLSAFRRFGLAAWLVAAALLGNAAAQNQLAVNVVAATTERAAQASADASAEASDPHAHHAHHAGHHGTAAADASPPASHDHHAGHHGAGGHTHKGHADCDVCGVVAVMAALTLPSAIIVATPPTALCPSGVRPADDFARVSPRYALYVSRAPPSHG